MNHHPETELLEFATDAVAGLRYALADALRTTPGTDARAARQRDVTRCGQAVADALETTEAT